MWNNPKSRDDNYWTYGYNPDRRTINRGEYNSFLVLRFLAIKIYITAMDGEVRNFQKENGHKSPLEKAVERTRQHFMSQFGNDNVSSKNIILAMISRFLIRSEMYEEVSSHFCL